MTFRLITSQRFQLSALLLILTLLFACKKDAGETVSEDQAVELVENAMSAKTSGTDELVSNLMGILSDFATSCNTPLDSTIAKNQTAGNITYAYSLGYNWLLNCNGLNIPTNAEFDLDGTSSYETLRVVSDDSTIAEFTMSNLTNPTQYTLNGTVVREGTQEFKVGNQLHFNSTLSFSYTNVIVNVLDSSIASGTAVVTASGTTTGGETFNYGASITFLGNKTATLVFNNGTQYDLNWQ